MNDTDPLIDRLQHHRTLGGAPREELVWLAQHGILRHLAAGEILSAKDQPVRELTIVLAGRLSITVDRGTGPRRIGDWRPGDVTGVLPYSRVKNPPGDAIAEEPSEVLSLSRDCIPDLIHTCHEVTSILVHSMLDRTRSFTTNDLHDEKMVSLGRMSAGLAHELNNPASAIERGAALLSRQLEISEQAARALGGCGLSPEPMAEVERLRQACAAGPSADVRSPLAQAEREQAMEDWLADHGIDQGANQGAHQRPDAESTGDLAHHLAESPLNQSALDGLARQIEGPALAAALRGLAAGCSVRTLAAEIQEAAQRIAALVKAIKGFTYMDQSVSAGAVDLVQGLINTVTVVRSRARQKAIAVNLDFEPDLPPAHGFGGELNQIWLNLIVNALDASPDGGRVDVSARREQGRASVRVVDNGGGIPGDVLPRIFDPFFTTKPVGSGTGLGLDIVRRLLLHNEGEISVDSRPGRTEFKVTLPLEASSRGRI